MIIYKLENSIHYQYFIFKNSDFGLDLSENLEKDESILPSLDSFVPVILMEREGYSGIKGKLLKKGDFTKVNYAPVFTEHSKNVLKKIVSPYGEFIELCDNYKNIYYLFHTMNSIDSLNINKSIVEYFSDGCISAIRSYSFHKDKLNDTTIFRVVEAPNTILVDDVFVSTVLENNLKGFVFVPLWDSEGKILPDKIET